MLLFCMWAACPIQCSSQFVIDKILTMLGRIFIASLYLRPGLFFRKKGENLSIEGKGL
jgi:hypothetical protein